MSYKLLTNLLFEPRGKHNPSLTYNIKDTVMSEDGGKVYFALDNVPAGIPLTDTNYWMLQMDLSASKNAMDVAAANARTQTDATITSANTRVEDMMGKAAEAVTSVADYAAKVGMRVKGETKITKGNPMTIYPDGGSLLKVQTDIPINQSGSGDPYPAGSRKNLCPPLSGVKTESGATFTPNADGSVTVSGTATAQSAVSTQQFVLKAGTYTVSGAPVGGAIGSYDIYVFKADGTGTIARSYNGINETFTISNDTNVALAMRVPAGTVDTSKVFWPMIEAGSTATAFMPYSNIRPFVGYDELELRHAGKNLCDISPFLSAWATENTATLSLINTLSPGTYTVSVVFEMQNPERASATNKYGLFLYPYGERVFAEWGSVAVGTTRRMTYTFNVTADNAGKFTAAYFYGCGEDGIGYTGYATTKNVQIEFGSTATPYEPYKGTLHTVQLGKTTYQGHYDWLTGKFKAEWKGMRLLSSYVSTSMKYVSGYVGAWMNEVLVNDRSEGQETILCSHLLGRNVYNWSRDGVYVQGGNTIGIQFSGASIPGYTDTGNADQNAGLVRAYLDANDVRIAWKLATPIEMQLAPNVITAIEDGGMNTIYGDGDIQVEYVKPLSESIKERTDILLDAFSESFETSGSIIQCEPIGNWPFDSVVTEFSPKQEGSGDPYPAGGGRNLMPPFDSAEINGISFAVAENGEITLNGTATANVTYVKWEMTLPVGTYTLSLNNSEVIGTSSENSVYVVARDVANNWLLHVYSYEKNVPMTRTLSSEIDHVYIAVPSGVTLNNFKIAIQLEKGSTATEYAPPENIRPISGWDKLNLGADGKNLFNLNQTYDYFIGCIITGDAITTTFSSNGMLRIKEGDIHPAGVYTLTIVPVSGFEGFTGWLYYADNDEEKQISQFNASKLTATIVADRPFKIGFGGIYRHPEYTCSYKVQLEVGSATPYEPYVHKLHTVQIGQTVYGGKFDWLTGKLIVDKGYIVFNGTEKWKETIEGNIKYIYYSPTEKPQDGYVVCSHMPFVYDYQGNGMYCHNKLIIVGAGMYSRYGTIAKWKEFLAAEYAAGTPVQVAYKLATPIDIQLTPTEIFAISGVNTLYGDGDTITAKFRQSKDVDILKRLSALETLITNQTKGE